MRRAKAMADSAQQFGGCCLVKNQRLAPFLVWWSRTGYTLLTLWAWGAGQQCVQSNILLMDPPAPRRYRTENSRPTSQAKGCFYCSYRHNVQFIIVSCFFLMGHARFAGTHGCCSVFPGVLPPLEGLCVFFVLEGNRLIPAGIDWGSNIHTPGLFS